jgi:hypothetical protein
MSSTQHDDRPRSQFVAARDRALRERIDQRNRAMRAVAGQARDGAEFAGLLSMLGLDDGPLGSPVLLHALAGYVREVATTLDVPMDAVGYEVSDTATAYLGLTHHRWVQHPDRDLMLIWDEQLGWSVAVETVPGEPPSVVGNLAGDTVPTPTAVATFVTDVVVGRHSNRLRPVLPRADRVALARRMTATCEKTP